MIAYFDTSAVIPLLVEEPGSDKAADLWSQSDRILSARILYPEGRAALAAAGRNGRLSRRQLRHTVSELGKLTEQLDHIEVTEHLAYEAGAMAEELSLRGYDAVHLAAAELVADEDLVLVAGDGELLRAAAAIGLNTARVG